MINLRDKSLGTPFINLTYYQFACGDEIPLKFVKSLIFYDQDCRSHFSDMNQRYDVRKSDLEAILMIRTEDTTCEKTI